MVPPTIQPHFFLITHTFHSETESLALHIGHDE